MLDAVKDRCARTHARVTPGNGRTSSRATVTADIIAPQRR
jgi:hypothetical protein